MAQRAARRRIRYEGPRGSGAGITVPEVAWWRLRRPCPTCPFTDSPYRVELRAGRMESIQQGLLRGKSFICHETIKYGKRNKAKEKLCCGALDFQSQHGIVADIVQIMTRIEAANEMHATESRGQVQPSDSDNPASHHGQKQRGTVCVQLRKTRGRPRKQPKEGEH